ncbi:DUF6122 family protein [Mesoflavibacter sp. SCSIO 43206]|jgi:hypothetical protein|uniref:DUF6122 family protein n=1 Tax=Mesoflavibacter TaxID=444051 RepID=UPI001CA9AD23|nr:DUF6122 family protein [Mesoflavibacter sp. SCSIO 43206]UAB75740.1 hypothetical protein INR78_01760 [Mesoflavibacter sp. SCSIO 43206]
MYKPIIHYGIHFLLPLIIALFLFKNQWKKAYVIMILGMLIDLDHLLATPIFAPNRCSINFHPLHSYYAIAIYILLLIPKKTRLIGLGLVIHILADSVDCLL